MSPPDPDWDELAAAGLFDPRAPTAPDRRAVLEELVSRGATIDQMVEMDRMGRLPTLISDLVLGSVAVTDIDGLAELLGLPRDRLDATIRAAGFPVPPAGEQAFTERDVNMLRSLLPAIDVFPEDVTLEMLRVIGSSLARVADAFVAAYLDSVERELSRAGGTELEHLRAVERALSVMGGTIDALGPLLVRQMGQAIQRSRLSRSGALSSGLARLAVGFVDLAGFTELTQRVAPGDLGRLVGDFEAVAADLVADHDGRLVKLIGDEVMFVALRAEDACAIASGLVDAFEDDERGIVPRGGIGWGDVLARSGDYYGPVVNLAARLAGAAVPLEVLASEDLVAAVDGTVVADCLEPAGRRQLKGFAAPVRVWSLGSMVRDVSAEHRRP
jgi:class 3 adenylate cyclase